MDSDPIVYGDAPEYTHDEQPHPKRPRLSTEDMDSEPTALLLTTPSASTLESRDIEVRNPLNNNVFVDHPLETSLIPGLFLATTVQPTLGTERQINEEKAAAAGNTEQQPQQPPPEAEGVVEDDQESKQLLNQPGDNGGVKGDEETFYDNEDGTSPTIPHNYQEPFDTQEDLGAFRDKEDFLKRGEANFGNPEAEWQLDSSAEESGGNVNGGTSHISPSSSDDDSSTTSGSEEEDDDEGEDAIFLDIQKEARRLMDEDAGSDDEIGNGMKKSVTGPLKTKNELPEIKLTSTRPNIDITASTPIVPLGVIDSVVDDLILVKASVSGEYQVLNEQSVLCFEDRSLLGWVHETFGRVEQPFYTVRLRDAEEVKQLNATIGRKISYIPSHSTFLFTKTIRAVKGSDASNLFDEEIGDDEREFSDDEAEAEFKKRQKEEKKAKGFALRSQGQTQAQAQAPDAIDEPYVPLSRPANLHEMSGPPSQANPPPRREVSQRIPPRDFQSNRVSRGFRGRGRGGRQIPQGRPDFRSSPRHQTQSFDNHHHSHRDDRASVQATESHHPSHPLPVAVPAIPPQVPLPLIPPPDLSTLLPFFAQGRAMPPAFSSGSHINSAFFPTPPNPQLPMPHQLGPLPPPPLLFNPAQLPILRQSQPQPPSVEEILSILRSQGHNL